MSNQSFIQRSTLQKIPKLNLSKSAQTLNNSGPVVVTHSATGRSQMSDARRQRLLNLQKRERLKALLVRKFRMKYGTGGQVAKLIDAAVEQFVQLRKVTEGDLQALERKVRAACRQLGHMPASQKVDANALLASVARTTPGTKEINAKAASPVSPGETIISAYQPGESARGLGLSQSEGTLATLEVTQNSQDSTLAPVPEDWTLINKYNMTLIEVEKRKERALKEEKRRRVKEELESQIQIKEEQKIVAGGSDKQYIEYLKKEQQRWKEEDKTKAAKKKAIVDRDRALLQKQVVDKRNRYLEETAAAKKYDENLLKRMKRELEIVKKKEIDTKIADKRRLAEFLSGNAEVRKQKEALKLKLAEEDKQRMKEYAAMLEKQEKARGEYFANMTKKQEKFLDLNVEGRKEEFEKQARMERINLEYQLSKEKADKQKEIDDKRIRREKDKKISDWIKEEMKTKQAIIQKEKDRYDEINAIGKQLVAKAQAEEAARKQAVLDKRRKYKEELESQIQGRAHLYEKVGRQIRRKQTNMDPREKEFNKSLIAKIKEERPDLLSPVVSPVRERDDDAPRGII